MASPHPTEEEWQIVLVSELVEISFCLMSTPQGFAKSRTPDTNVFLEGRSPYSCRAGSVATTGIRNKET